MQESNNLRDIIGQRFGKLIVDDLYPVDNIIVYNCTCDCGKLCIKSRDTLLSGKNLSCGCDIYLSNPSIITAKERALISAEDLIGQKFNRLTPVAIDHIETDNYNRTRYYLRCKCDCGGEKVVEKIRLTSGEVKSCGCLHNNIKDVDKGFVNSFHAMKSRCNDKNNDHYKYYGERGITYDPKWEYFENFKKDMYDSYIATKDEFKGQSITIDRKDVDDNYYKDNCRWVTLKKQANNKRNNRRFKLGEEEYTASELVDKFADPGIDYEKMRNKLRNSNKYAIDDKIINTDVFRNEEYRNALTIPIKFINKEDK